ncbi:hypothetical protein GJU80_13175, partial [Neisseria brasiliensis]|nr:hypothetical protein [Neisseria brasiliensis]
MKEINTPDKRFVDGNGRDVLGTVVTADWLNAVQGEIVGLITGLNAKVNGAVPNQMYRAIANALAEKANANTTITAGTGLTGGGNLSANRTITLGTPSTITATSGNTVAASSHSHAIDKASTTAAGIVQLNNTLTSSATNQALTAAMGKKLQDEMVAYQRRVTNQIAGKLDAAAGVNLTGDQTISGVKTFNNIQKAFGGIQVANNEVNAAASNAGIVSANHNAVFIQNIKTGKFLELRHDGRLIYDGNEVYTHRDRSNAIDSDDAYKIATSKA